MALITPARHPRISFIKNRSSPKTPLRSNASPVGSDKTPITEFVEDLTPETRNIVYNMLKKSEENMTPLTKRRRLEKVTDSPMPANGNFFFRLSTAMSTKTIFFSNGSC